MLSREPDHRSTLLRCCLVWLAATALPLAALPLALPPLTGTDRSAGPSRFADLLVTACAVLLLVGLVWLWAQVSLVVLEVVSGRTGGGRRHASSWVRRAVLAACGLAVLASGPAGAAESSFDPAGAGRGVVAGLALPDRPVALLPARAGRPTAPRAEAPPPTSTPPTSTAALPARAAGRGRAAPAPAPPGAGRAVVDRGDSLWRIAERRLGNDATDRQVDRAWRRIWAANRDAVGADPDLIHPGTVLHLPALTTEEP